MNARGFFITGTDTGVGKTFVTACLCVLFRQHHVDVGIMKPVETGIDSRNPLSDAELLVKVSGVEDKLSEISPYRFKVAASPYQAGKLEGRFVDINRLTDAFHRLTQKYDLVLVEGVGGLLAPITREHQVINLVADWNLQMIIVSRLPLGTINHTLLTLHAAKERGIKVAGVIFNPIDDREANAIEKTNPKTLEELSGVRVLGELPFVNDILNITQELLGKIERSIDFDFLRNI